MTDEQYDRIWAAFTAARQTAMECMQSDYKSAEREMALAADNAAIARFAAELAAARRSLVRS